MLAWLTPTCSATSATDNPRLMRASRRWRAKFRFLGKVMSPTLWIVKRWRELSDRGSALQRPSDGRHIGEAEQWSRPRSTNSLQDGINVIFDFTRCPDVFRRYRMTQSVK